MRNQGGFARAPVAKGLIATTIAMWMFIPGHAREIGPAGAVEQPSDATCLPLRTCVFNGNFETGDLTGWTSSGINPSGSDVGFASVAREGTCFSANDTRGVTFHGTSAANVRSHTETTSVGILTSSTFIAGAQVSFRALSENTTELPLADPVTFEVRILDGSLTGGDAVLQSQIVKTNLVTLSFNGCFGGGIAANVNGVFGTYVINTSALAGRLIQLQFRQHTHVHDRGFFTLVDDVEVSAPPPAVSRGAAAGNSGVVGDPVSTGLGEFYHGEIDLSLGGPLPLAFGRYYASRLRLAGVASALGTNWMHNFDLKAQVTADRATIQYYEGKKIEFARAGDGSSWRLRDREQDIFQFITTGTSYRLMDPSSSHILTFSDDGKLQRIEDRNGNAHVLTYDSAGQLLRIFDEARLLDAEGATALARSLNFTYDASGRLTAVADQTGRAARFEYDTNGFLAAAVATRGDRTMYSYEGIALLTSLKRPLENVPVRLSFDSDGRVLAQTDGAGRTYALSYANGWTSVTDPNGGAIEHTHQGFLHLSESADEAGNRMALQYDANNRRTGVTDPLGEATSTAYHEASGKVAAITTPDGTATFAYTATSAEGFTFWNLTSVESPDKSVESYVYDGRGNMLSWTDRAGKRWTLTYNSRGQILTAVNPEKGAITYIYNPDATVASATDPVGNVTTFGYDVLKRRNRVTHPDGTTRGFTYDAADDLVELVDEAGRITRYVYDANNRLRSVTDALEQITSFNYDGNDRPNQICRALACLAFEYDHLGNVTRLVDRNGNATRLRYDRRGLLEEAEDAAGKVWRKTYDAAGRLTEERDPNGNAVSYAYDIRGRMTRRTTPSGTTQFTYDRKRLTAIRNPIARTSTLEYDAVGQLRSFAVPGAGAATYTRTSLGQLASVTDPNGGRWRFEYDPSGRLVAASDPLDRATTYQYDNRNRLSRVTYPDGLGSQILSYDAAGNITRRLSSDGTDLTYTFDKLDRLIAANNLSIGYDPHGKIIQSNGLAITRDPDGQITAVDYGAGKVVRYEHDARGLLSAITDWVGGRTTFSRDNGGRLISITRRNGVVSRFTYNGDNRVIEIRETAGARVLSSLSVTRDASGRITSAERNTPLAPTLTSEATTLGYDAASRVTGHVYDGLGRLMNDGTRRHTWDLASRLLRYEEGTRSVNFQYDALGQMITRQDGAGTEQYVWNYGLGLPSVSILRSAGSIRKYYIHTPEGMLLYSIDASGGARHFYHFDEMGHTLFLTNDTASIVSSYAYTPDGALAASSGATGNPFTWLGKFGVMQEGTAGLYYARQRFYDSRPRRFLSRDPLALQLHPHTLNPYQYAAGNPLFFVDPTGEDPDDPDNGEIRVPDSVQIGLKVNDVVSDAVDAGASKLASDFKTASVLLTKVEGTKPTSAATNLFHYTETQRSIKSAAADFSSWSKKLDKIADVGDKAGKAADILSIGLEGVQTYSRVEQVKSERDKAQATAHERDSLHWQQIRRLYKSGTITLREYERQMRLRDANFTYQLNNSESNANQQNVWETVSGFVNMGGELIPFGLGDAVIWISGEAGKKIQALLPF